MAHINRGRTYHKPVSSKSILKRSAHKRVRWELIVFPSLTAIFAVVRLYLKMEFPETYFDIAEHSCLLCEVASFLIPGE